MAVPFTGGAGAGGWAMAIAGRVSAAAAARKRVLRVMIFLQRGRLEEERPGLIEVAWLRDGPWESGDEARLLLLVAGAPPETGANRSEHVFAEVGVPGDLGQLRLDIGRIDVDRLALALLGLEADVLKQL